MRGLRLIVLALTVCAAAQARPLLTAYRVEDPPQIDGNLEDACWQRAQVTSDWILATRDALPDAQTQVRACWDDDRLYLGIEAMEPNLDPRLNMLDLVRAEHTERDSRVFGDDCVEIFLQPDEAAYYQLAVNSIGALYDARVTDAEWNGDIEVAAQHGTTSYTVELSIGFDGMGAAPEGLWRANFCRDRTAVEELSTWSGLQGAFHQPAQFGELSFASNGPTARDVRVRPAGEAVAIAATLAGEGAALTGIAESGDATSRESVSGVQAQKLSVPLPEGASGRVGVIWELADGDTVVQRSAALPVTLASAETRLSVTAREAEATAWLNGEPLSLDGPAALDLQSGLNVLALHATAEGDEPSIVPTLTTSGRAMPVRWLQRADNPPDAWAEQLATEGWERAEETPSWPEGAEQCWLTCGLYLGEAAPQLFPKMQTFYVPRGSRQLMRFYAHIPDGAPTSDYRMVVDAPAALDYRALETVSGMPPTVSEAGTFTADGIQMHRYHLDFDTLPGAGMELSLRWANEHNVTTAYQPSITTGGTHDWKHLSMTVTAPGNAASVHPLIIKWQNRGITGTFWVDNLVFREAGSDENLLKMGTFDEPGWGNNYRLKPEGPDGSMCCKIVSKAKDADRQQALWVDKEDVTPVEPGKEYVVELDARCENVVSSSSKPILGLLFEAPEDLEEGAMSIYTSFQSLGGAVTEIPRRSSARVLSELRDVRPERARITPCYGSRGVSNPNVVQAWADNTWQSGMTWVWGNSRTNVAQLLIPRGLEVIYHLPWGGWNAAGTEMHEYLDAHQDLRAIDFDGKPERNFFCPTWFLSDDGAGVRGLLRDWVTGSIAAENCSQVNWDLEQPVVDPPTFCTCNRCMAAFRERDDVPDDAELTPEKLLDEYRDRWVDFRCSQNARMAGLLAEMVHSVDPELEFSVYSGYQSKRTREHYGVDWALMQPHLDMAIAGYGGSEEAVRATLEAMDGKPFMGGEMWYLSHLDDSRGRPRMQTWCNRLLRKFVQSGCTGVLIWHLAPMEGGSFHATSEATALIAEHEDWLREQLRCDEQVTVEGIPVSDWAAFERDGEIMVLLLNFADEPAAVTLTVADDTREIELAPYAHEAVFVR